MITKKKVSLVGFFVILLMVMSFAVSQFQSSLTKVDYVEGSKTLKFTTKVSTEQIANALKVNASSASFNAEVAKYIGKNFSVAVNGENKSLKVTGSQVNGETVFIYFEVDGVASISTLKIKNNILLDVYPKQLNLVNIAYKGSQKNMTFQRGKETAEVSF